MRFWVRMFGGVKYFLYFCGRVSPTRPAPRELRQILTEAAVPGCSGAM